MKKFLFIFMATLFLAGCSSASNTETKSPSGSVKSVKTNVQQQNQQKDQQSQQGSQQQQNQQNTQQQTQKQEASVPAGFNQTAAPQKGDKVVIIETDEGTIEFKLFDNVVPEMSKNFEELANSGKYDNVPFHRVIKDFMIQGGDFSARNGTGGYSYKGPGTKLPDEFVKGLKHLYGTVSMANAGPNTNGSQFFIVTSKNGTPHLDGVHTIIGQVYKGMDVAEKIANYQSDRNGKPSKIVMMKKVTVKTVE